MKLLLDENLPEQLKEHFQGHQVFTTHEKGWKGKRNGELLKLLAANDFDALITADKSLQYQHNFEKFPIPVIVLRARRINILQLQPFVPKVLKTLKSRLKPGPIVIEI